MRIVKRIEELDHPVELTTGLVPTMGGFHEGHLQLMRVARKDCQRVVVSLFVNPTQFGAGEDYERYPRDFDRDAALAEGIGVDVLFAPNNDEIYPRQGSTIHVPVVTTHWEGEARPGHFAGVATVVCKLFNIVRPNTAYFGQKDLQQSIVITRMTEDLNIPVQICVQPTVREPDGLAMSTRNGYLTDEERTLAPMIYNHLTACKQLLLSGALDHERVSEAVKHAKVTLEDAGYRVDYFELIELETMKPTRSLTMPSALIAAARLGKTRLIDNVLI